MWPVGGAAGERPGDTDRVSGVSGDFDDFVAARWRELHAVATVTTGDPVAAARKTASALALLGRRWQETTAAGTPTATARAAVLTAALTTTDGSGATADSASQDAEPGPDGGTRAALTAVLLAAAPTARAALAARHWWDESPTLVATCARSELAAVTAELAGLDHQLARAHAAALGRDEAEVEWALAAAVADTLEQAVDGAPVADPVALVAAARNRGTRHRTRRAVVGAGLALAVVAATALAWPVTSGAPQVAPDDPTWAAVSSWSPRGTMVDDPTVLSIAADARAADPLARVVYAGPVGDTVALVMTGSSPLDPHLPAGVPGPALGEGFDVGRVFLRLWIAVAMASASAPTTQRASG